jgi:hypothetical protein
MKKTVILSIFLLLIYSVSAFSFSEMFTGNLKELFTGSATKYEESSKDQPPTVEIYGNENIQVITTANPIIQWEYNDAEGDEQTAYYIQYSKDDIQFNHPFLEAGIGSTTSHRITLRDGDGTYYIRVKAKDDAAWSDWSDYKTFYLDTSRKACSDGTDFYKCSVNKPEYCDGGVIISDCSKCGCLSGFSCDGKSGTCSSQSCVDNTLYDKCSNEKPKFCLQGNLVNMCSLCGCPIGQECQANGECKTTLIIIQSEVKPKTFLQKISDFFKNLF